MAFDNGTHLAKHFRKRLRIEGIKARCRVNPADRNSIQVFVPKHGMEFTEEEQRAIRFIADCNKLTRVRGTPIDVGRMTDPHEMTFWLPGTE